MSYARKNGVDSDVYVYQTLTPDWRCHECLLGSQTFVARAPAEMLDHLQAHRAAGHRVPDAAIERLTREAADPPPPLITAPGSTEPIVVIPGSVLKPPKKWGN